MKSGLIEWAAHIFTLVLQIDMVFKGMTIDEGQMVGEIAL